MTMRPDYYAHAAAALRRERRALAGRSPRMFAKTYLSGHCSLPFSRMHVEIFTDLEAMLERRPGRLAIAAPRGHAKSTIITLAFLLWCVLYDREKLILIVSATRDQAVLLLKPIKDELRNNAMLLEDFPEVCRPEGARGQPNPWRSERILLPNGAMIAAYGAGQSLRGAKVDKHRPGLIIADDIENQEQVIVEEQRQKLQGWFNSTLLHAGHPNTNVVIEQDPYAAAKDAHAVLVLTEWDEFRTFDYQRIFEGMYKPAFIFDGRNILDLQALREVGFDARGIGK